jgi:gas vesicle protein
MSDEKNTFLGTVFTFLTGAAIGAGLALLFAPQSGEETRKKIKDMGDKLANEAKENYEKISKETQKAIETVKTTTDKAVEQVKAFVEGAKEGLKKEIKEEEAKPKAPAGKKA